MDGENWTRGVHYHVVRNGYLKMGGCAISATMVYAEHDQVSITGAGRVNDVFSWFAVFHYQLRSAAQPRVLRQHLGQVLDCFGRR